MCSQDADQKRESTEQRNKAIVSSVAFNLFPLKGGHLNWNEGIACSCLSGEEGGRDGIPVLVALAAPSCN